MASNANNDLFSSLVTDIKSYTGTDPLLPWIRGVRRLRDKLHPDLLKEKLPRFLQKGAQTFETDQRYKNDVRYIQIWLQLMDYVENPKAILRTMDRKGIGTKLSLFYQAYALYYEKLKRFEEAEKMYRLGAQNLAEPMDKLQKSYEQFLQRTGCHINKNVQIEEKKAEEGPLSERSNNIFSCNLSMVEQGLCDYKAECDARSHRPSMLHSDDTVMKFIGTDTFGTGEAENYFHQGLLEPKVATTEAMVAVNGMLQEPLVPSLLDNENFETIEFKDSLIGSPLTSQSDFSFVFPRPNDHPSESTSIGRSVEKLGKTKFHEDTVVCKFVGAAISDEPEVENICHHGLVEPTVNLKEAMEDINNMFGKPIDFVRTGRKKKEKAESLGRSHLEVFSIFCDDDLDDQQVDPLPSLSGRDGGEDIFEPTVFMKEAMDEINKMFSMPMDL